MRYRRSSSSTRRYMSVAMDSSSLGFISELVRNLTTVYFSIFWIVNSGSAIAPFPRGPPRGLPGPDRRAAFALAAKRAGLAARLVLGRRRLALGAAGAILALAGTCAKRDVENLVDVLDEMELERLLHLVGNVRQIL